MMQKIVLLAIMGAVGTLARYFLQGWVQKLLGPNFPWGTLVVNLCGCFMFGIIWALAEEQFVLGPQVRLILLVGFMGAFTTFSSFIFESGELLRDTEWGLAALNLLAENGLGLVSFFAGLMVGRIF